MKTTKTLFIGILALALAACNKDDVVGKKGCFDIPPPEGYTPGYDYQTKYPMFVGACFNPNNPQELSFTKNLNVGSLPELWKVNLVTGQQQKITENVRNQPDWSTRDWLIYSGLSAHIYKIKSNGDSLTQVTTAGYSYHPFWRKDGKQFVFTYDNGNNYKVIASLDDKGKQVFATNKIGWINTNKVSPDGKYISGSSLEDKEYALGIYSLPDYTFTKLVNFDFSHNTKELPSGVTWYPDSRHLFWASQKGVFKVNIESGQIRTLKTGCDSRTYSFPTISSDGLTIAVTRTISNLKGNTIYSEQDIVLMDTDGRNEKKLAL